MPKSKRSFPGFGRCGQRNIQSGNSESFGARRYRDPHGDHVWPESNHVNPKDSMTAAEKHAKRLAALRQEPGFNALVVALKGQTGEQLTRLSEYIEYTERQKFREDRGK